MGQLFFKKPLQVAIREGRKCTTIRRWAIGRPLLRAGQRAYALGVGWLRIEAVERIEVDRLSEADALADGFESAPALRAVLRELYPEQDSDGRAWFRVRFTLSQLEPVRKKAPVPRGVNPRRSSS